MFFATQHEFLCWCKDWISAEGRFLRSSGFRLLGVGNLLSRMLVDTRDDAVVSLEGFFGKEISSEQHDFHKNKRG